MVPCGPPGLHRGWEGGLGTDLPRASGGGGRGARSEQGWVGLGDGETEERWAGRGGDGGGGGGSEGAGEGPARTGRGSRAEHPAWRGRLGAGVRGPPLCPSG